ncbi:MAG: TonB-dependent receptor domain-containing protein, partial [Candidatus Binatia bacterium]
FGLTWNPLPETTLRAAVFRVLKRNLILNQTIEPTQVAGFNQFFDDPEGTEAWRYGIAFDQKFSAHVYAGTEFSKRDLEVPFVQTTAGITKTRKVDWDEYLARAYIYWTPHPWLAASAEYQFERFERDREFTAGIRKVETHRLPLGIKLFHPSGFSARLKATYVDQDGSFQKQGSPTGTFVSGSDQFWVVDAAIGYRFPRRRGLFTVEVRNLFNEGFRFQDTDPANPVIQPERLIFARFTLSF